MSKTPPIPHVSWMDYEDWSHVQQDPPKRVKRQRKDPYSDLQVRTITNLDQSCETGIDIEDLGGIQCGGLICAPIVPSQTERDFPDSSIFRLTSVSGKGLRHDSKKVHRLEHSRRNLRAKQQLQSICSESGTHLHPLSREQLPPANPQNEELFPLPPLPSPSFDYSLPHQQQQQQCLLERVNPEYFDRHQFRWHSSMEQVPDMSETMSIDPESAQDFTAIYSTTTRSTNMLDMSLPAIPEMDVLQEHTGSMLARTSSPRPSTDGAPRPLLRSIQQDGPDSRDDGPVPDYNPFEDVDQMFNWEEACAALVDEHIPDYRSSEADTSSVPIHVDSSSFPVNCASLPAHSTPSITHSRNNSIAQPVGNAFSSPPPLGSKDHYEQSSPAASSQGEVSDSPSTTCHNCGVTKTPLWRRTPDKRHSLCNACGLYLKQYKIMRPLGPRNRNQTVKKDEEHLVCSNCEATKTSLWRKDEHGQVICNACGLYHKLHGKARPITMRKEKISRRKRYRNLAPDSPELQSPQVVSPIPLYISPVLPVHDPYYSSHESSPLAEALVA